MGRFRRRRVLAALLTPHGLAGLETPIRLVLTPVQTSFGEWLSPDFQKSPALEMWVLGLVLIGFATGIRLPPTRLLLLLGLLHMTLAACAPRRSAGDRRPAGAGRTARPAAWRHSPPGRLPHRRLVRPLGAAGRSPAMVVAAVIAAALAMPIALAPIVRGDDTVTPATALAAAQRLGLAGPVLNSEIFGGYLVFRGVPSFFDGRIEMYGNDFLAEGRRRRARQRRRCRRVARPLRIGWTLLTPSSAAVAVMDGLSGWQRVYADDHAVIHRRSDPAAR